MIAGESTPKHPIKSNLSNNIFSPVAAYGYGFKFIKFKRVSNSLYQYRHNPQSGLRSHVHATIDMQRRTGDVGGPVGRQKNHGRRHVRRRAQAL